MVVTDVGMNKLASNFAADITKGQWGTGTATPVVSNTGLGSAIPDSLLTVTSSSSGNTAQFQHDLPSTASNGYTLAEFELQYADGTNFNRQVGGGISKTNSFDVTTVVSVSFIRS